MDIKEELDKIICEQHDITNPHFDLFDYIKEGWTTEEDLYDAIEKLMSLWGEVIIKEPKFPCDTCSDNCVMNSAKRQATCKKFKRYWKHYTYGKGHHGK